MKVAYRKYLYMALIAIVIITFIVSYRNEAEEERIASYQFKVLCESFPRIAYEDLETAKNLAKKIVSDGRDPSDSGSYYIRNILQQGEIYYTPLRFWRIKIKDLYLEKRPIIYNGKLYFYSNEIIMFKKNKTLFPVRFGELESTASCKGSIYDLMGKLGRDK